MGWIIAGLVVAAILAGICVYAYYYNNVWHPPYKLPDDMSKVRNETYNKKIQENTITWVSEDGETRSMCPSILFAAVSHAAFEDRHCLICDLQGDGIIRGPFSEDGFDRPRQICPACTRTFKRAVDIETDGGERVFPNYDIDDIDQPYDTWRQYAYILRQMEDGTLSDEDGREQIHTLLNKRSRSAQAARQAIIRAANAQAIAFQSAAAERRLQNLTERARRS